MIKTYRKKEIACSVHYYRVDRSKVIHGFGKEIQHNSICNKDQYERYRSQYYQ
jgi:hypothetical protein